MGGGGGTMNQSINLHDPSNTCPRKLRRHGWWRCGDCFRLFGCCWWMHGLWRILRGKLAMKVQLQQAQPDIDVDCLLDQLRETHCHRLKRCEPVRKWARAVGVSMGLAHMEMALTTQWGMLMVVVVGGGKSSVGIWM